MWFQRPLAQNFFKIYHVDGGGMNGFFGFLNPSILIVGDSLKALLSFEPSLPFCNIVFFFLSVIIIYLNWVFLFAGS